MNRLTAAILVLATACALGAHLQAQDQGNKQKGIFGLLNKFSKPGNTGENYTTLSGRTYGTNNFRHLTADQGKSYQQAMDEKSGFRSYRFGMTGDEFAKAAKDAGETFRKSLNPALTGPDAVTLEPVGQQFVNEVSVQILYGFYKGRFALIQIKPTDTMVSKGKAAQVYQAIAEKFGPGLTLRDPKATVGGYAGVIWFSDKMEIQMAGGYDPSDRPARTQNSNLAPTDATAGECPVLLSFASKEVLKEYFEKVAKKATAGI